MFFCFVHQHGGNAIQIYSILNFCRLSLRNYLTCVHNIGSISTALSSPVFVPPREETDSFPEQRLEIEPNITEMVIYSFILISYMCFVYSTSKGYPMISDCTSKLSHNQ